MEESTLQDSYTDNDTAISAYEKDGMQDTQPAAACPVNIVEQWHIGETPALPPLSPQSGDAETTPAA